MLENGAIKGLQIGRERLQIGRTLEISNWCKKITYRSGILNRGKKISNWSRDYKSGQERFQIGAGFTNSRAKALLLPINEAFCLKN